MKHAILIFSMLLFSVTIFAQNDECSAVEYGALAESRVSCADLEEGQACYGSSSLSADLLSDDLSFESSGDRVALDAITIISSSRDDGYGVAMIHTIGYGIDSWQSLDVALVLLGDVSIANTGNENINVAVLTAPIVGSQGANVRSGSSIEYRLITTLFEGDIIKVTGRLADDTYYRVQLPSGETGWIAAGAVEEDVSHLPVVDVNSPALEILYAPYTSFSLETATTDAQCVESWESGLLIQSPEDSEIRLQINQRSLLLSGTAFVQSRASVDIRVFVIEGSVQFEDTMTEAGFWLRLPLDGSAVAIEPYEFSRVAYLPTEILPRYIYIGLELSTIITPAPSEDRSPIADTLVTEHCVLTTGESGANLRAGPSSEFPIRGVLAFRETANPIGKSTGSGGRIWWELAQNLWVNGSVVVTGGDCFAVPQSQRIPILPTTTES